MVSLKQSTALKEICRHHGVKRLHAFGSFARDELADASDVDLVVEFADDVIEGAFDRFMALKEDLETCFGREVDLLAAKRLRNPFFAEELERTKKLIYAA